MYKMYVRGYESWSLGTCFCFLAFFLALFALVTHFNLSFSKQLEKDRAQASSGGQAGGDGRGGHASRTLDFCTDGPCGGW